MSTGNDTIWLFDLGNSRLKYAPWRDGALGEVVFVEHDGKVFAPEWEQELPESIGSAHIASVAGPPLADALVALLSRRCDHVDQARTLPACAGVRIAYAQPRRLGVDRFLALLAAHARTPGPVLIVGVGTALTVDLLDGDGLHRGGRIAPSPTLMREMLQARAPHLPVAGGDYVAFAADTADALASGCQGAALGLVTQSLEAASALLGITPRLLLHGGGAGLLLPRLADADFSPTLVLDGLVQWAQASD